MFVAKKFAALGAAAAISATGLVAATGVSANAASTTITKTYSCSGTVAGNTLNPTNVPISFDGSQIPTTLTQGDTVSSLPLDGTADLSGLAGSPGVGSALATHSLITASVPNFAPTIAGTPLPFKLDDQTVNPLDAVTNGLAVKGNLIAPVPVAQAPGSYAVAMPRAFTLNLSDGATSLGSATCTISAADAALGNVTIKAAGGSTTTPPANSAALKAAKAKLAKDQKALKAAKKAVKKAKGHKKVVLKKKVTKLTKAVKKDRAKVKSLSK